MNSKHLACLLIVLLTIVFAQGALEVRKRFVAVEKEIEKTRAEASAAEMRLAAERNVLTQLRETSAPLIEYYDMWRPFLDATSSPEAGELAVAGRIKRSGIVTLAQRFGVVPSKENAAVPRVLRATLTFEDAFPRVLNWLGETERDMPASRVTTLRVVRGQAGNDIRMDAVLDLPLMKSEAP